MTQVALITDTHYGCRNDNSVFYDYFAKSTESFLEEIEKKKPLAIFHLGDLFDRRKYINYVTAERCRKDFLEPINNLCENLNIEFHIIAGNHDEYYRNTHTPNSLTEIIGDRYSNIRIYDRSVHVNIDSTEILLMPWITDSNRAESIDLMNRTNARYCFGHFDIIGFELHRGVYSDHGFDTTIFSKFDGVYTGHYHKKQSSGNIHYIGSAHEFTWSDYGCPRGFSFLDLSNGDLTFHRNNKTIFRGFVYDDVDHLEEIQKISDFSTFTDKYASEKIHIYLIYSLIQS
jgi:DNA repair exonuclease SbcCD nuclease subunit